MSQQARVAISLGASFMGYATHAGFMARLHSLGVRPVAMAGASAGAITAGLYAAGLTQESIRKAVLSPRLFLSFASRTKWIWHQFLDVVTRRAPGLFDSRGAIAHFESLVGKKGIESLNNPRLMIALCDLAKHETAFATRGPLAVAMAASSCVPVVFTPLEFEGRRYTDGGIAHETPVDPWFTDEGVDHIILHRINQPPLGVSAFFPSRLIASIAASHETMSSQILADRMALARLHGKRITVATTLHHRPSPLFPGRLKHNYALGEATAQQLFDETLSKLL